MLNPTCLQLPGAGQRVQALSLALHLQSLIPGADLVSDTTLGSGDPAIHLPSPCHQCWLFQDSPAVLEQSAESHQKGDPSGLHSYSLQIIAKANRYRLSNSFPAQFGKPQEGTNTLNATPFTLAHPSLGNPGERESTCALVCSCNSSPQLELVKMAEDPEQITTPKY